MKSIARIATLILIISTNYIISSQPKEALAEHQGTLEALARLRTERHEKRLIALGRKKPVEQTVPHITNTHEKEKPACGCCGCFSRICKLVFFIFCNTKK